MTTTPHKLLSTFQEWDTAQRAADRARSDMHGIIAALPVGREQPDEAHTPRSLKEHNPRNRPVIVTTTPPEVALEQLPTASTVEMKPKQTRAKRASEADIRKAVKLVYDEDLTQKEAEIMCNLPPGTLSRRKGKQIMDGYRKEWGTPTSITGQRGVRRKDVEKANKYENR